MTGTQDTVTHTRPQEYDGRLLIDAIRLSDGVLVQIQQIRRGTEEAQSLALSFSSDVQSALKRHLTPVFDTFDDESDQDIIYVVTPFLRPMDSPPFDTTSDIICFTTQVLDVRSHFTRSLALVDDDAPQGLLYLHQHGLAHG